MVGVLWHFVGQLESCLSLCIGQKHFLLWKICDIKSGNISGKWWCSTKVWQSIFGAWNSMGLCQVHTVMDRPLNHHCPLNYLTCFLLSCKPFHKISGSDCLHISTLHIPDYNCEIWSMNNNVFEIDGEVPVT